MAKLLKLRLGVSDDPQALQPSLADCLEVMLQQAPLLMTDVINGLVLAVAPNGPRRVPALQSADMRAAVNTLSSSSKAACASFHAELSRAVYQGGGKEQVHTEALRYEDLQLFGDDELDQSIEVARAQQEVQLSTDDVLPTLDALISTMMGWRTIQPGLNPLRPEVFVRALQSTLALYVPQAPLRETMIAPAAGLLGNNLRKLYRELSDWLASTGVEPAVPLGGKVQPGSGASGAVVADTMAKTLLTLGRLRRLLAGDFDRDAPRVDYLHTVPASMAMLQDMKQVDALVKRLQDRPTPPAPQIAAEHEDAPGEGLRDPRLGLQLGEEVVRMMFDNLTHDARLVPAYQRELMAIAPAVQRLAAQDSRFFSDRAHPARQFLERLTQRSLAFSSEADEGWPRFLASVQDAVRWLDSKVIDAETFGELLDHLHTLWNGQDEAGRQRREEGARALLHAEQRNLLAQRLAAEFADTLAGLDVPAFVGDFLKGSWAQVVAQAQLTCTDGSDDPFGYRALVDDLVWSVQKSTAQRGRARRLTQLVPPLLGRLRDGLARIDYPPELTERFFNNLVTIHQSALQEGRDAAARAAAEAVEAQPSQFGDTAVQDSGVWLAEDEAQESGYVDHDSILPADAGEAAEPVQPEPGLRTGAWVELMVDGQWTRVQLTWASPHATLLMFTSLAGTAHSMSRRSLERLRARGLIKLVAQRNVVDEALDLVAKAALRNSLGGK